MAGSDHSDPESEYSDIIDEDFEALSQSDRPSALPTDGHSSSSDGEAIVEWLEDQDGEEGVLIDWLNEEDEKGVGQGMCKGARTPRPTQSHRLASKRTHILLPNKPPRRIVTALI
jgi:hypothetical protein